MNTKNTRKKTDRTVKNSKDLGCCTIETSKDPTHSATNETDNVNVDEKPNHITKDVEHKASDLGEKASNAVKGVEHRAKEVARRVLSKRQATRPKRSRAS